MGLRRIIGLRNILILGYARIRHAYVFDFVKGDLPTLLAQVEALLRELDPSIP